MRKALRIIIVTLVFLTAAIMAETSVTAAGIGFSVRADLPENQRDNITGYFDLDMKPGQVQDLNVIVKNDSEEEIVVSVEAVTASTNLNGIIDYNAQGVYDETLKHSFADMSAVREDVLRIPAQSEKTATITVTMPDEEFDGVLLGSIRFLKALTEEDKNTGSSFINQFAYVIAVKLQENDNPVPAEFALGNVTAGLENLKASIVAEIHNPQPKIIKNATVAAQIYTRGDNEPIMELTKEEVEFAPNSIFPFTLMDEAGYGIKGGNYIARIQLTYEGQTWDFEQEFEIKPEEAAQINERSVNQTQQRQTAANTIAGFPTWAVIAVIVGVLILLVVGVLLLVMSRVREQDRVQMQKLEDLLKLNRK